jgi:hypothetical protein
MPDDEQKKVKVMWHKPGECVPSMINVWTKCDKPRLYTNGEINLIAETWCKLNKSVDHEQKVKVIWHMSGRHVPTVINMWTKYG